MSDLSTQIHTYLQEQYGPFEMNADLLESGIIDSLGIVELIGFLEDELSIDFDASTITAANFKNIATIAALVENK